MAETIQLDPSAINAARTTLDITSWVAAAGPDWGDSEIVAATQDQKVGSNAVDYRIPNRTIKIPLALRAVGATTFATIRLQLQQKASLLQRQGGSIMRQAGASSTPLYADVVNATLHLGGTWLQAYRDVDVDAVLTLECVPDWYGAEVTLDTLSGTGKITAKLQASAADAVIAGNMPGRVRIIVTDTSGQDQKGLLWGWRSTYYSSAASAATFIEAETMTALNGATQSVALAGASGGNAMRMVNPPKNTWVSMLSTTLASGPTPLTHKGTYRVWARLYSTNDVPQFRLVWGVGSLSVPVTNDPVKLPGVTSFFLLDLGQVVLDPMPVGTHQWLGAIQVYTATATSTSYIDALYLQPLDDGGGRLVSVDMPAASAVSATGGAGTVANDALGGTVDWTSLTSAQGSSPDQAYAQVTLTDGQLSHWLKETNYSFALPSSATVVGIQVVTYWDVLATPDPNGYNTYLTQLVKGGTIQASSGTPSGGGTYAGGTWDSLGGPADLWGVVWLYSDINAAGFGVARQFTQVGGSFTIGVDAMVITVYYTLAGGFTVAQDRVIYASHAAELRTEGMMRDAGSGVYGKVGQVIGELPRIVPSGLENQPVELFLKATRGRFSNNADAGLDSISAQVRYRPSYLYVGS